MLETIFESTISIIVGIFIINLICEMLLDFSPWGIIKKKLFKD